MIFQENLALISGYKQFAGKIEVPQYLRWTGAAYLGHFLDNLKYIEKINPVFAQKAAEHKLNILREFEKNWQNLNNLVSHFNDVYIGSFNIGLAGSGDLIRCSQPSLDDLAWLQSEMNVKLIINLREDYEYWEGFTSKDEEEACLGGAEYINIPLENWDESTPTKECVEDILKKIDYHLKPALIHCAEGKERSGIVAAAYQLSRLGKSWESVLEDAARFGFDPDLSPNQMALMKSFERSGAKK